MDDEHSKKRLMEIMSAITDALKIFCFAAVGLLAFATVVIKSISLIVGY